MTGGSQAIKIRTGWSDGNYAVSSGGVLVPRSLSQIKSDLSLASDFQPLNNRLSTIGSQGNPTSAKLTQLNTDGTITFVDPPSSGNLPIVKVTTDTQQLAVNTQYNLVINVNTTLTLPIVSAENDRIIIVGGFNLTIGLWDLKQNANNEIAFGTYLSNPGVNGGLRSLLSVASLRTARTFVELVATNASSRWRVTNFRGNVESY